MLTSVALGSKMSVREGQTDNPGRFHGDNTGSNPVGDANQNQHLAAIFA